MMSSTPTFHRTSQSQKTAHPSNPVNSGTKNLVNVNSVDASVSLGLSYLPSSINLSLIKGITSTLCDLALILNSQTLYAISSLES